MVPSKGGGSFVNTVTKARFVPRGAHYVRLATVKLSRRYTICMSSDFDVGTGLDAYNPHRAAQALSEMQGYGYNEVSVGLNPVEIGNPSGSGLDPTYLANLASFVNIARADGIRVSIDLMSLPQRGGYLPSGPTYSAKTSPKYHNTNLTYIDANFLAAQKRYVSDVITGLSSAGANLEQHLLLRADRRSGLPIESVAAQPDQRVRADRWSDPALQHGRPIVPYRADRRTTSFIGRTSSAEPSTPCSRRPSSQ